MEDLWSRHFLYILITNYVLFLSKYFFKSKLASKIIYNHYANGLVDRVGSVFTNGSRDHGSILSQVIPKTQKILFNASLLNTQHYKVWIKGKWSNPGKGVAPSPTPECSSFWKGNLHVTLDNSQPTLYII